MKVIARFSGIVTYSDNSSASFAVHLDDRGRVSYNGKPSPLGTGMLAGKQAVREVDVDTNWIESMIAPLTGTSLTTSGTTSKTVTGLVAEFSGRVSIDSPAAKKPSFEDFAVQFWSKKNGANSILGASQLTGTTNSTTWPKVRAVSAVLTALNTMFNQGSNGNLGLSVS